MNHFPIDMEIVRGILELNATYEEDGGGSSVTGVSKYLGRDDIDTYTLAKHVQLLQAEGYLVSAEYSIQMSDGICRTSVILPEDILPEKVYDACPGFLTLRGHELRQTLNIMEKVNSLYSWKFNERMDKFSNPSNP